MDRAPRRRPWLAALLASLVTGLGHLYLRRWRRGLGWVCVAFVTAALFVSPDALTAYASGGGDLRSVVPLLAVSLLSAADAYVVARSQNATGGAEAADADARCPNCGRELDQSLDFCHWCTTARPSDDAPADSGDE